MAMGGVRTLEFISAFPDITPTATTHMATLDIMADAVLCAVCAPIAGAGVVRVTTAAYGETAAERAIGVSPIGSRTVLQMAGGLAFRPLPFEGKRNSDGAACVTRTHDPVITNDVLYRLS
jgi:hypothetical protein